MLNEIVIFVISKCFIKLDVVATMFGNILRSSDWFDAETLQLWKLEGKNVNTRYISKFYFTNQHFTRSPISLHSLRIGSVEPEGLPSPSRQRRHFALLASPCRYGYGSSRFATPLRCSGVTPRLWILI